MIGNDGLHTTESLLLFTNFGTFLLTLQAKSPHQ